MSKPILILMVGICASGKSTQAKILSEQYNAEIISSDDLRVELYGDINDQDHNEQVFKELNKRVKNNLNQDNNVIIDATNINLKSRRKLLENVAKIDCYKIAYIMAKPIEQCLEDNIYRDNPVPHHVINKMYMNFQVPFYEEGFDEIIIHNFDNIRKSFWDCLEEMQGFNQRTPYHKLDLYEHSYQSNLNMQDKYNSYMDIAYMLHDYSKLHTQTFNKEGIAHYYQHHGVGAYKIMTEVELNLQNNEILDVLFLVNYHMLPFNWETDKARKKWKRIFGEEKYNMLISFNEADKKASGIKNID